MVIKVLNVKFYVLLSFVLTVLFVSSCSNDDKVFLSGNIENGKGNVLVVQEPYNLNNAAIDSVSIKKNGDFKLVLPLSQPTFLNLSVNSQNVLLLVRPGERVVLNTSYSNFASGYEIEGSKDSERLRELNQVQYKNLEQLDTILLKIEAVKDDVELEGLKQQYVDVLKQHKKHIVSFILQDMKSLTNIAALYQKYNANDYYLNSLHDIQYYKIVRDSLMKYYPKLSYVKTLDANTKNMIGNYQKARLFSQIKDVQKTFPNIALPTVNGDTVELHDKKGRYTLLFFWAPALKDNRSYSRQLMNVYETYKNKGFDIYQVAFNSDLAEWKKTVIYDEIPWTTVCDTRGAQSAYIGNFNVVNFPTLYLISPDFEEVVGKNLSLRQLDLKLNYLINEKD